MSRSLVGIIGGSGLYAIDAFHLLEKRDVLTPFGKTSGAFMMGKLADTDVVFLARHGEGHVYNPSEINFRANIWAMKSLGVTAIFSVSAVGSLKEEIVPGHVVVIDQFIDRTRTRPSTFFENGIVAHVGFAHPVSSYLRKLLIQASRMENAKGDSPKVHETGTYLCMEGPQFSTLAESRSYQALGADVIGMTNLQEAKLCREAEIDYATLALATDYDCWHPHHDAVTVEQIMAVLKANVELAQRVLTQAVKLFDANHPLDAQNALKNAIMTDRGKISPAVIERLKPILGRYFSVS